MDYSNVIAFTQKPDFDDFWNLILENFDTDLNIIYLDGCEIRGLGNWEIIDGKDIFKDLEELQLFVDKYNFSHGTKIVFEIEPERWIYFHAEKM